MGGYYQIIGGDSMNQRIEKIVFKGVPFDYYISDMGYVYNSNLELIYPKRDNRGYLFVRLHGVDLDGKPISIRAHIHRLVAEAYIPNPDNLPTVNHLHVIQRDDGTAYSVKDDNRYFMLEWASYSDNNQHAIDNNLRVPLSCENHQYATMTNEQVIKACELLEDGWVYEDIIEHLDLSEIPNIKRKLIMIKTGNAWKDIAKNYTFSNQKRIRSDFTEQMIHDICKMLQDGETDYGKILDTIGVDDTRLHRKTVSTIKTRKKYKNISKSYIW